MISFAPTKYKYVIACKSCGHDFGTNSKITQYCKECAADRKREMNRLTAERLRKKEGIKKMMNSKSANCIIYKNGQKQYKIPKNYIDKAKDMRAAAMGLTYGKFTLWMEKHEQEYMRWFVSMEEDFVKQKSERGSNPEKPSATVCKIGIETKKSESNLCCSESPWLGYDSRNKGKGA